MDIEQFEMFLNDPRMTENSSSIMEELKSFLAANARHGGMLASKQVAALANVNTSTIARHVKAGRFTTYTFADMTLLPMDEVMAYLKARNESLLSKGGHGLKGAKFSDLMKVG